ncbi:MAG: hypothetical protein ACT4OO_08455 [Nitrospiraceae bacterium]
MSVSPEEFFMYLTIALIVVAPIGARLYRRATMKRTTEMLRAQFGEARNQPHNPRRTDSETPHS